MDNLIYDKEFKVYTSEVDFRGQARAVTLLNYLQDAASEHATILGMSVFDLLAKNMAWLLSRYHVIIHKYPGMNEKVLVRTWPSDVGEYFALRDFEAFDADGRPLVSATSSWVIVDIKKKRPLVMDGLFPACYVCTERRAVADDFASLPVLDVEGAGQRFRVLSTDLDMYRHVNNTVYTRWALESVPEEILLGSNPVEIEISYRAEAFFGQEIEARSSAVSGSAQAGDGLVFLHRISNTSTGVELTRLKTRWNQWRQPQE